MQFMRLSPGRAPACEGSGKSTLLRLIAGLARPVQGHEQCQLRDNTGQRGCSIVFQAPRLMYWRRVWRGEGGDQSRPLAARPDARVSSLHLFLLVPAPAGI